MARSILPLSHYEAEMVRMPLEGWEGKVIEALRVVVSREESQFPPIKKAFAAISLRCLKRTRSFEFAMETARKASCGSGSRGRRFAPYRKIAINDDQLV